MKTLLVATAFAALALACLPRGQAPVGERVLASRTVEQVMFAPGPDGDPARLVTTRRRAGLDFSQSVDVYGVSRGEGLGVERLLLDQVVGFGGYCVDPACGLSTDSRGRLLLLRDATSPSTPPELRYMNTGLVRVDPLTGDQIDLGKQTRLLGISPDRRTFAYQRGQMLVLRDVDDQEVDVGNVDDWKLVGGDLYVQAEGTLSRLRPPYGTREELARGLDHFVVIQGSETLLGLCRRADGALVCAGVLLDPATGIETLLPPEITQPANLTMSPSGRYLFGLSFAPGDYSSQVASFYDRRTGTAQSTTVDLSSGQVTWRPGHDEVWFTTEAPSPDQGSPTAPASPPSYSSWRWRPGEAPSKVSAAPLFVPFASFNDGNGGSTWPFTPDGRFWLSYAADGFEGDKPPVVLRSVDDASFAPLLLNPAGTAVQNVWPLADGRLVVEDRISNEKRSDIYLVDPAARTTRQLGHSGNVVATGATRILVFLDWLIGGGSGELTLIDLETGARTLLAENVHAAVVEKAAGADALAPGARIAFISRHRIESPYDGLWVARLP